MTCTRRTKRSQSPLSKATSTSTEQTSYRSTKNRTIHPPTDITAAVPLDSNDVFDHAALIMVIPMKTNNTNYTDLMGKFPVESFMRNNYLMLSFYRGYVHTEAMKDRSSTSLV